MLRAEEDLPGQGTATPKTRSIHPRSARSTSCAPDDKYVNCLRGYWFPFVTRVSLAAPFSLATMVTSQWLLWGQAVGREDRTTRKGREREKQGSLSRLPTANCRKTL